MLPNHTRLRLWSIQSGPLALVIARGIAADGAPWQLTAALAGALALGLGCLAASRWRTHGAIAVAAGLSGLFASIAPQMTTRPLLGLVLLIAATALLANSLRPGAVYELMGQRKSRLRADVLDLRLGAAIAIATWLLGVALRAELDVWSAGASAMASLLATLRAIGFMRDAMAGRGRQLWSGLLGLGAAAAALALVFGEPRWALSLLVSMPVLSLLMARVAGGIDTLDTSWMALVIGNPARLVVTTFLALSVLGLVLLSFPWASAGETTVSTIDAAFTAVSAVCVTGLITVDTPNAWSTAGQVMILLLIQLGGLGIMTLSAAALGALGRRLSVRHEEAIASLVSGENRGHLFVALRRVLGVTLAAELAGALCLAVLFHAHGDGLGEALWRGLFTAISAFCNAGFALQSDSLIPYQNSPLVLHTIAVLIIAGGLSPAVVVALPRLVRRQPVPLQAKIVVSATAGLLAIAFVLFAAVEWSGSLAGLSTPDRLHNAWFQSVTLRTAGFNSVAFEGLHSATLLVSMLLMFIGGAPGGTAGGIKVTSAWVFGATAVGGLRGQPEARSFGRTIGQKVVYRAIAIAALGGLVAIAVLFALLVTQPMAPSRALFETVSAVGTVGLSTGGTAELDGVGKCIIMAAMFLGRVGPLTAFLLLQERRRESLVVRLEESVEVG